jgi:tRNA-specific 2-thiouridylase
VAAGAPRYVVALRDANTVVLGERDELLADRFELEQVSWIAGSAPDGGQAGDVLVQIRHRQRPVRARVIPRGTAGAAGATVELAEPLRAVAPGQSAVVYRGDEVLGGGVIRSALG